MRKDTGPNQVCPGAAVWNAGSCERVAGDVYREAPNHELLAALRIDLRDVGHRRHEAQQLEELDAPLLEAFDSELRQGGEGELLLDLAHELLDARRRRNRLFPLQGRERALVFLVGEVQPDGARNQQRAAHQAEDQQEILAEETPAPQPRHVSVLLDQPVLRLQALSPAVTLSPCPRASAPTGEWSGRAPGRFRG